MSQNENENKNKSKLIALAITSTLLLGSSSFLYLDNNKVKELNEKQKIEITTLSDVKTNLLKDISLIKSELNEYKGKNNELNSLVASAQKEISRKEKKIKQLIHDNASIKKLKAEAKEIKRINDKYTHRIKDLEDKVFMLSNENSRLKSDNVKLKGRVDELEAINAILERKVSIASILKVENVTITGEKKKSDGSYTKSKLRRAYRFAATFDVVENKVTEPGEKIMYVRIIDSKGNLIQNNQSGTFTNADDNMEFPYTEKHVINYSNKEQKVTIPIELDGQHFTKGTYAIEFYCEGHFSGVKKLLVK